MVSINLSIHWSIITSDEDSKDQVESSSKNLSGKKDYLTSKYAWITNLQVT